EQLLLFVPRQRALGGERLSKDGFTLRFELKQDFARQGTNQTKRHEIGSSLALEMRENIAPMKTGDQSVRRRPFGGVFHARPCAERCSIWQASSRAGTRRGSAGFPACGFWGLSSPQFQTITRNTELESSVNPQAGMPALRIQWSSPERCPLGWIVIFLCASVLFSGCALGPNYKPPQTSVSAS